MAAAALAGVFTALHPAVGAGLCALTLGLIAASQSSARTIATVTLFALAVSPSQLFPGTLVATPEVHKAILVAGFAPVALRRGVHHWALAPIAGYVVLALVSRAFGTPWAGVSWIQTSSSIVTLSLGWAVASIRWTRQDAKTLLAALALLPIASISIGAVAHGAGLTELAKPGGVPRLQGALIPALLGAVGAAATAAALVRARIDPHTGRPFHLLAIVNALITTGTLTRGSILAVLCVMAPAALHFVRTQTRGDGTVAAVRGGAAALLVALCAAVAIPLIAGRAQEQRYDVATQRVEVDGTSGRFEAWAAFYDIARDDLIFGRGIGAGPAIKLDQPGFTAQHNEYLRAILETGYIGLVTIILLAAATLSRFYRRTARGWARAYIAAQILAFALYSGTDNSLTSQYLAVPWLLTLALTAAAVPNGSRHRESTVHPSTGRTVRL